MKPGTKVKVLTSWSTLYGRTGTVVERPPTWEGYNDAVPVRLDGDALTWALGFEAGELEKV